MPFSLFSRSTQLPPETPDQARIRVALELRDELERAMMRAKSVGMPVMALLLHNAIFEAKAIIAREGRPD